MKADGSAYRKLSSPPPPLPLTVAVLSAPISNSILLVSNIWASSLPPPPALSWSGPRPPPPWDGAPGEPFDDAGFRSNHFSLCTKEHDDYRQDRQATREI